MKGSGDSVAGSVAMVVRLLIAAAWVGIFIMVAGGAFLVLSSDYETMMASEFGAGGAPPRGVIVTVLVAGVGLLGAVVLMLQRLRRVIRTVQVGEPFHPRNPRDLRVIALLLVLTEIGSIFLGFIAPPEWGGGVDWTRLNVTAWLAALVTLVLAEVFREGARLKADAELTV